MTPQSSGAVENPAEHASDWEDAAHGSVQGGETVYLAVGKLRRSHGIHGEIFMDIYTDFPERIRPSLQVFVGENHEPMRLRSRRVHGSVLLVAFHGVDTPEATASFRNQIVYVSAADSPTLKEGEYYHHQILGLRAVDEAGRTLGTVKEILETGSNDVYVIRPESGPEILLPVIDETILGVDLEKGELRVHILPGLIPDNNDANDDE